MNIYRRSSVINIYRPVTSAAAVLKLAALRLARR